MFVFFCLAPTTLNDFLFLVWTTLQKNVFLKTLSGVCFYVESLTIEPNIKQDFADFNFPFVAAGVVVVNHMLDVLVF